MAQPPDDLDLWLARLAGNAEDDAETASLKRAIEAAEQSAHERIDGEADSDAHATETLLFRLRREQPLARKPRWRRVALPVAIAASLVLASYLVMQFQTPPPTEPGLEAPPRYRGEINEMTLVTRDAKGQAERLTQILKGKDIPVQRYFEGGRYYLDFELGNEEVEALVPALSGLGLTPQAGQNRIAVGKR